MTRAAQIIRDGSGKPAFAVIPIDDYERLLEAADDAQAVRAFDAYKAAQPETFPDAIAQRLLDGIHPVSVFRDYRGWTVAQLAEATGIALTVISQIESGEHAATADELTRLAAALQVEVDDLT